MGGRNRNYEYRPFSSIYSEQQSAISVRIPLPQAYLSRTYSKKPLNEKTAPFKISNDRFKITNRFHDMLFLIPISRLICLGQILEFNWEIEQHMTNISHKIYVDDWCKIKFAVSDLKRGIIVRRRRLNTEKYSRLAAHNDHRQIFLLLPISETECETKHKWIFSFKYTPTHTHTSLNVKQVRILSSLRAFHLLQTKVLLTQTARNSRLMVFLLIIINISSWPSSSCCGIEMLAWRNIPARTLPRFFFYHFSVSPKRIRWPCGVDHTKWQKGVLRFCFLLIANNHSMHISAAVTVEENRCSCVRKVVVFQLTGEEIPSYKYSLSVKSAKR
uniref:Uncharacterized protein n=1 Tax=Heterorhabditis bacteriophora TaxID=37862 RepID=A0A1I7WCU8_HETBA